MNWAELDSNDQVIRITVGDDNEADKGYQWLIDNLGGKWVEAKDAHLRAKLLQDGSFLPPQPFPSWKLSKMGNEWKPPKSQPNDGLVYYWDETNLQWSEIPQINLDGSSLAE